MDRGEAICGFAFRKPGGNALHCKAMSGRRDFCIFQELCQRTGQFEIRKEAANCGVKKSRKEGAGEA